MVFGFFVFFVVDFGLVVVALGVFGFWVDMCLACASAIDGTKSSAVNSETAKATRVRERRIELVLGGYENVCWLRSLIVIKCKEMLGPDARKFLTKNRSVSERLALPLQNLHTGCIHAWQIERLS